MRLTQEEHKKIIKEQIFCKLSDDEMELISLTDNKEKIYWEEEEKEFLFEGKLYDVVKTKIVAGKTILYCINDKIEKELINKYNTITKNNSSKDKKAKGNVETATTLFVIQFIKLAVLSLHKPVKQYCLFIFQLPTGISNQPLQPPKCL